ncbi:S24 family peptidase [Microbulbifer sp. TRSA002]|uniref:S24 family peptidase n=1 Tax=Microbulbifer sp. TRSA002 TaxID=3243382 RepID=UPI00403A4B15
MARANGGSMQVVGIFDRDVLIADRSLTPMNGDALVVALDGQLTCKILDLKRGRLLSPMANTSRYRYGKGRSC